MSSDPSQTGSDVLEGSPSLQYDTQQNLGMGLLGGVIGLAIGAFLWAILSVLLDRQIGWMAIGVGFLVGTGMWLLGRGTTIVFGIAGAVLSLAGVLIGNALAFVLLVSREAGVSVTEVIPLVDWGGLIGGIISESEPIDYLFYALALYAGFRFAFRKPAAA